MFQSKKAFAILALIGAAPTAAADHKRKLLRNRLGKDTDMTEDIAFWTRMTQEQSLPLEPKVRFVISPTLRTFIIKGVLFPPSDYSYRNAERAVHSVL